MKKYIDIVRGGQCIGIGMSALSRLNHLTLGLGLWQSQPKGQGRLEGQGQKVLRSTRRKILGESLTKCDQVDDLL